MTTVDANRIVAAAPGAAVLTGGGLDGYDVCGLRPQVAVQVRSADDVAAVLALSSANGWSVSPRGGGTMLDLGNPPRSFDIALDLSGLDQIVDYQPDDLTLTVQAGVTVVKIDRLLAERGQILALDAPQLESATIGGLLATNASGPRRTRYGTARDLCIGMQVALTDGTLARSGGKVVKNVAGYDLNKLHIGALGTLGVITEATFKLWPAPEAGGAVVATFDSLDDAHTAAMRLLNGRLFPAAVELVNPAMARNLATQTGVSSDPDRWLLAALLVGVSLATERQVREIVAGCLTAGARGAAGMERQEAVRLFDRLCEFGRGHEDRAVLTLRVAVLPNQTLLAARVLESLGRTIGVTPELVCRPSAGLAIGFWNDVPEAGLAGAIVTARHELAAYAGALVIERAPIGATAGIDVWGLDGPDVGLMRRLKETYDPNSVLNPGRFVAGL